MRVCVRANEEKALTNFNNCLIFVAVFSPFEECEMRSQLPREKETSLKFHEKQRAKNEEKNDENATHNNVYFGADSNKKNEDKKRRKLMKNKETQQT